MPFVFEVENAVSLAVGVLLLGVKIFAFVNSLFFLPRVLRGRGQAHEAGLGRDSRLGLALQLLFIRASPINILNIAFTVAAFVYLADVRPALGGLRRR